MSQFLKSITGSEILTDQESPPYVTAIRVRFKERMFIEIYLLNVWIFIKFTHL